MLRAVLCATEVEVDAELNTEFSALMSKPTRLSHEESRLYMLAREIIITAGLEADPIRDDDRLRIAAALITLNRHIEP